MQGPYIDRCTPESHQVLFCARYEAACVGSQNIEGHHLLLGLLREHQEISASGLRESLEVADSKIRAEIIDSVGIKNTFLGVNLPLSEEAKRILHAGAVEAAKTGNYRITPDHLVLGILHEDNCIAARVLRNAKIDLDLARTFVNSR